MGENWEDLRLVPGYLDARGICTGAVRLKRGDATWGVLDH